MKNRRDTYTTYSIGCALTWAFILAMLAVAGRKEQLRKVLPFFGGWWMGWTSATLARYFYPPRSVDEHRRPTRLMGMSR